MKKFGTFGIKNGNDADTDKGGGGSGDGLDSGIRVTTTNGKGVPSSAPSPDSAVRKFIGALEK